MQADRKGKVITTTFREVKLANQSGFTGKEWREGLVAGNGRMGVIWAGTPETEVLIFQNMDFIMPTCHPRHTPQGMAEELFEARQSVLKWDDSWDGHGRKRTYMYPFHPGEQLRMSFPKGMITSAYRQTDYETGELKIVYEMEDGRWERSTVASYEDDVIITRLQKSDRGAGVWAEFSVDDLSNLPKFGQWKHGTAPETTMKYCKFADAEKGLIGLVVHYPSYEGSELAESGYLVISKLVIKGGNCSKVFAEDSQEEIRFGKNPVLQIREAEEVFVLTKTVILHDMGSMEAFCGEDGARLREKVIAEQERQLQRIIEKYSTESGVFGYEEALSASVRKRQALFGQVSLWLAKDGTANEDLSNETLLQAQKKSKTLLPEMTMRVYAQGRYALESCSTHSVPRLCGLWTGEFNPAWAGAYTMDANVNIQVSGMNVGNLYGAGLGYIYFILRQVEDWKKNAKDVYGMEEAILIPVNTDGARAMMVECDKAYPFQYWNAGAAWMMVPLYEFWQCFGNGQIPLPAQLQSLWGKESLDLEQEILRPLLHMTLNFWRQLCTPEYYVDRDGKAKYCKGKTSLKEGEHYLIIPSYSPENKPVGYNSSITANAAMDISAARDCMHMVIHLEEHIGDKMSEEIIATCKQLLNGMPEYLFDETGALQEWALQEFKDNNEHRHISHLYCAWPAYETQKNSKLQEACKQAIRNREETNRGKDDASSHGWIHRALVAARLKDGEGAAEILRLIFSSDIFYSTLMTDHDINKARGVYCTDTSIGLVGVIQEMLLYSDEECVEFLPAAAPEWKIGKVCGLLTRNGVLVKELSWDKKQKTLRAVLNARDTVKVRIACGCMAGSFHVESGEQIGSDGWILLKKGEDVSVTMS